MQLCHALSEKIDIDAKLLLNTREHCSQMQRAGAYQITNHLTFNVQCSIPYFL